jgi:hypothetical protein
MQQRILAIVELRMDALFASNLVVNTVAVNIVYTRIVMLEVR